MNRKNGSGAGIFMMEMIVAVFFFVLCASTCILVFVKADSLSRLAKDTNGGVVAAESVAEVWKAGGTEGLIDRFQARVQAGTGHAGRVEICWDREWNAVADEAEASYLGVLSWEAQDGLETAHITVSRAGQGETGGGQTGAELFSMTAARYLPERS